MANKLIIGADLSSNASYSPANVPVNGDVLYVTPDTPTITAGWTTLVAVALTALHVDARWTGICDATAAQYIQLGATTIWIGEHDGIGTPAGSARLKLDVRGVSTCHVLRTARTSSDAYMPPVRLLFNNASSNLYVREGEAGVGIDVDGETSTVESIFCGNKGSVIAGAGTTLGGWLQAGGEGKLLCAATGVVVDAGTLTTEGAGAIGAITQNGGLVIPNSTGTVTTYTLKGGDCDALQSNQIRTITTMVHGGGRIKYDAGTLVITNYTHTGFVSPSGRVVINVGAA